jgi:hypothetical protein
MIRLALAAIVMLGTASCGREPQPSPEGGLFEKGPYQAIYGPDGRITRLLHDGNRDKVADVVTLFHPNGKPRQTEIDADYDGAVERWQSFSLSGTLEKEAMARRKPSTPDLWLYHDAAGAVIRRELDEDGDGVVDWIEHFEAGHLARVEVDSDRDGRIDRWQALSIDRWQALSEDRLIQEDVDTDGDGVADRRLRYDANGDLIGLDVLVTTGRTRAGGPAH